MSYRCPKCPAAVYVPDSGRACWNCGERAELWQDFSTATTAFSAIYSDVTGRLRAIASRPTVQDTNRQWFDYLIHGFHDQYLAWQWKPDVRAYLLGFHRARVPRLFSLSGDVYLHISYDLPRVIATSLGNVPADDFGVIPRPPSSVEDGSILYLAATDEFFKVLDKHAVSYQVSGLLALPAAIARSLLALRVLGFWVIALRNAAWIHAQVLAKSVVRDKLEESLITSVRAAAADALKSPWNPARWSIPTPQLLAFFLSFVFLGGASASEPLTMIAVVVAVIALYSMSVYALTVRSIDRLGRAIYNAANAVFESALSNETALILPPEDRPRPLAG